MIFDIAALVIAFLCIGNGIKKGFVKAFFGTASFLLALILTFVFADGAFEYAKNTEIAAHIYEKTAVKIIDAPEETENESFFDELIDKKGIIEKAGEAQKTVSAEIGDTVVKLLTTVLLFVAILILLKIAAYLLNTVVKLPVLRTFNKFGGFFAGVINAYILLTVFACVVTLIGTTAVSQFITEQMAQSRVVSWFYLNNPLL